MLEEKIIVNKENKKNTCEKIRSPKIVHLSRSEIKLNGERNKFYD